MATAIAPVPEVHSSLLIRGVEVAVVTRQLEQARLQFFADNPRVYSVIRADGRSPAQDEIQRQLLEMEHVKELIQDIRRNGGLLDPVIVREGTLEVLEGNSRLAAYRALAKDDPAKWAFIKCTILPAGIDESLIFGLLGQYHIKGKKDWAPYEQAGFLYRRFKTHKLDLQTLALDIGLSQRRVKHLIDTYQFMLDHGEAETARWSYYDEYLKSSKIRKARERFPEFDALVVKKIDSGEIERAVDIRDRLPILCTAPGKALQKFATGGLTFEDALEDAIEAGGDSLHYKKLARFRQWLAKAEVEEDVLRAQGQIRAKVLFELDKLAKRVETLRAKLRPKL
jgi:hypothetical protein